MAIQTNQINITLNKTQVLTLVQEVLQSEDNTALLRAITPALQGQFPQFKEFSNVSIENINEDGTANVSLKIPRVITPKTDDTASEEESTEPVTFEN